MGVVEVGVAVEVCSLEPCSKVGILAVLLELGVIEVDILVEVCFKECDFSMEVCAYKTGN